jgi:hypothetical protein
MLPPLMPLLGSTATTAMWRPCSQSWQPSKRLRSSYASAWCAGWLLSTSVMAHERIEVPPASTPRGNPE